MRHHLRLAAVCAVVGTILGCGPGQRPPTFPAPAPITLAAETVTSISLVAVDPDGDAVTIALSSPPTWAKLEGTTLTLTPKREDVGDKTFDAVASAVGGDTNAKITVKVTPGSDRAPVLTAVSPVTVAEGETKKFTVSATDPDADAVTYSLAGSVPAWATMSGADVTLAPGFEDAGKYSLVVRAADPSGGFTEMQVLVTVSDTDRGPALEGPASGTVAEGSVASFAFKGSDPDHEAVTVTAEGTLPPFVVLDAAGVLIAKPDFESAGTYPINLVGNAHDKTSKLTFTLTVTNVNRAPTIARIPDANLLAGDSATINFNALDADGDTLAYAIAGAPFATVVATATGGTVTLAPDVNATGDFALTVTADDGKGGQATAAFTAHVAKLETPPTVTQPFQRVNGTDLAAGSAAGGPIVLGAAVFDAQSNQVKLEVEVRPSEDAFAGIPTQETAFGPMGTLSVTLPPQAARSFHWQVRATDDTGRSSAWQPFAGGGASFVVPSKPLNGSLVIDEGNVTTHRLVTVHASAVPSAGASLATVAFSDSGVSFDTPRPWTDTNYYLLGSLEGVQTIYAKVTDSLGNEGTFVASITYDPTPPVVSLQLTNNGTPLTITNAPGVSATYTAHDAGTGVGQVCLSNDGLIYLPQGCSSAVDPGGNLAWTLPSGDGMKVVYARFADKAGNTAIAAASVALDQTPPSLALTLGGGTKLSSRNVPYVLAASDASGLGKACLAEDQDPPVDGSCTAFAASGVWVIAGGEGTHSLHVAVTDAAGNVATATSPTVTYDVTKPTVTLSIPALVAVSGTSYTNQRTLALGLAAPLDATDVVSMQFSNDDVSWSPPEAFAGTKSWTLVGGDGAQTVSARVIDGAGNVSSASRVSFVLDQTPPTATSSPKSFVIEKDNAYTTTATVNLSLSNVADVTSGLYQVEFFNAPSTSGSPEAYTTAKTGWTLAGSPNTGTPSKVYARVWDRAGNATLLSDDILYDTTQATITADVGGVVAVNTAAVTLNYKITYPGGTITQVCAQNETNGPNCSLPVPTTSGQAKSTPWTLSSGDGAKTINVQATRSSGVAQPTSVPVILDTIAPVVSAVTPRGLSQGYTNAQTVVLDFSTSGTETSPITGYCIGTTGTCSTFGALSAPGATATPPYALPTEGTYTLTLRLQDQATNASTTSAGSTATVKVDRTAPTGDFKINQGGTYAKDKNVTVTFVGLSDPTSGGVTSGVSQFMVEDDAGGKKIYPYTSAGPYGYTLAGGDGQRKVTITVCDVAGNCTPMVQTVVLDTVAPTGTLALDATPLVKVGTAKWTNTASLTGAVTSSEDGKYCVQASSTPPGLVSACWLPLSAKAGTATLTASAGDGAKTYYAYFMDPAGNITQTGVSDVMNVDATPPTLPSGLGSVATHHQVNVAWSTAATDPGIGLAGYEVAWSYASAGPFTYNTITAATATNDTVVSLLDDRTIYTKVRVSDKLGNKAETGVSSVFLRFPFYVFGRPPVTEDLKALAATSSSRIMAVGDVGIALTSASGGAKGTWVRHDLGADVTWTGVAIDPAAATFNAVAVSQFGDLATTKDGGVTFARDSLGFFTNAAEVAYLGASPAAPRYVIGGSSTFYDILLRRFVSKAQAWLGTITAYDGTDTWAPIASTVIANAGTNVNAMAVCPAGSPCSTQGNIVLAVDAGVVVYSNDGGTTWTKSTFAETSATLHLTRLNGSGTVYFLLTASGNVWYTTNGGSTWTKGITTISGFTAQGVSAPSATKLILLGYLTAQHIAEAYEYNLNCTTTCTFTGLPVQFLGGTSGIGSLARAVPLSATTAVGIGDRGAVATAALGANWTWTPTQAGIGIDWRETALSTSAWWYCGTDGNGAAIYRGQRTALPGAGTPVSPTFTAFTVADAGLAWGLTAVDDTTAFGVGLANGNYRIYRATNGTAGLADVTPSNIANTAGRFWGAASVTAGATRFAVAVGSNSEVAVWNGTTWASVYSFAGTTFNDVATYYPTTGGAKMVIVGTDGNGKGAVWTAQANTAGTLLTNAPAMATLGFATNGALNGVAISQNTVIAVGDNGQILRSANSGLSWTSITPVNANHLKDVSVAQNHWVAAGASGTIITSYDDGLTWSTLPSLDTVNLFYGVAISVNEIFATGWNGTLLYSASNGL